MRKVDLLIAEIGSTTTIVSALEGMAGHCPVIAGQGQAPTTVLDGDVTIGLHQAVAELEQSLGDMLEWKDMVASSSAAGGLRMTVHGLVYEMTVKAAREAALGAGANIHWVTAGLLQDDDVRRIEKIRPNIILLAGGVDYGERATVVANAKRLTEISWRPPVIFAGNKAAGPEVSELLEEAGFTCHWVENVYPDIDQLNIEPTRKVIHDVFEKHIVEAPGMQKIREMVTGRIIPTPGSVMRAAQMLKEKIGDLAVLDVGGATTDVHSVTDGDPEIGSLMVSPEPLAKRTVEGDLGVYVNAENVLKLCDLEELSREVGCEPEDLPSFRTPIPSTDEERKFVAGLTKVAVATAMARHAGNIEYLYGPSGRIAVARGKDLTRVKWLVGTGGALTRLSEGWDILMAQNRPKVGTRLLPRDAQPLLDKEYIMAAAGLLVRDYPETAWELLRRSLGLTDEMLVKGEDS